MSYFLDNTVLKNHCKVVSEIYIVILMGRLYLLFSSKPCDRKMLEKKNVCTWHFLDKRKFFLNACIMNLSLSRWFSND